MPGAKTVVTCETNTSTMAERPRDESAILRRWVSLKLNIRLKGYVSRQRLYTIRWENRYTTSYNFVAENFHTDTL